MPEIAAVGDLELRGSRVEQDADSLAVGTLDGQQLPPAYIRDARYTVSEPGRYRLRYPGAGYRWVIVDGDAYLVRSKTGVVRDVVRAILS